MKCTTCGETMRVVDVVKVPQYSEVYRHRKCDECGASVYTLEMITEFNKDFRKVWNENARYGKQKRREKDVREIFKDR